MDYTLTDAALPLHDKDQHAIVGEAFGMAWREERDNRATAYVRAVIIAVAKEAFDARHPENHDADPFDAASTVLGAIAGYEGWPIAPVVDRDGVAILVRLTW